MASSTNLLSEVQIQCSLCLDLFTDPVTTPCGHNFCLICIKNYWDRNNDCPVCKKKSEKRPDVRVNETLKSIADHVRRIKGKKLDLCPAKAGEVACDVCNGTKLKAVKSCLVCVTSYCKGHLEYHQRVVALRKHKLIDPVENLEERLCRKHEKPIEYFCNKDQSFVCQFCTESDHKSHNAVPLEEESVVRLGDLARTEAEIKQMIWDRMLKIQEFKQSVELSQVEAEKEKTESKEAFGALLTFINSCHAVVVGIVEERQASIQSRSDIWTAELELEISWLKKRSVELEKIFSNDDHFFVLRRFPSLSAIPATRDWTEESVHKDMCVGIVRKALPHLERVLGAEMEKLAEVQLKKIQQYAVDITLDPDTAYSKLNLSDDCKQVTQGNKWSNARDNPKSFTVCPCVLGKEGFCTGKAYYEVQVKGKTDWDVGVARESINRKSKITLNPEDGYWAIWHRNGKEYKALAGPGVPLFLKVKPQTIGVYVDYEEGQVSFYDVDNKVHIYSFTGYTFTERLYPYFGPCSNSGGKNSAPIVIHPITNK